MIISKADAYSTDPASQGIFNSDEKLSLRIAIRSTERKPCRTSLNDSDFLKLIFSPAMNTWKFTGNVTENCILKHLAINNYCILGELLALASSIIHTLNLPILPVSFPQSEAFGWKILMTSRKRKKANLLSFDTISRLFNSFRFVNPLYLPTNHFWPESKVQSGSQSFF